MNEPSVPEGFLAKLHKLDRNLGVEWLGTTVEDGHWCIVDESKVMARHKHEHFGVIQHSYYRVIYDRIFHLKPGQPLGERVFQQLWRMDKNRWGREEWLEKHLNIASGKDQEKLDKEKQDFRDAMKSELKTLKRFGVTVPGRRDKPNTIKD